MSIRDQPWFPSCVAALHYCGSCVVTLVFWAAGLALTGTLVLLISIALAGELPVPAFVWRQVQAGLAAANLEAKFGQARFDPTGRVLLENVSLRLRTFEEPLLSARFIYLQYDLGSLFTGHLVPAEIRFEGARLQLPAMLSPSGTAEPLLRDLAGTLRQHEGVWQVDQLSGWLNNLALTVHGTFAAIRTPGAPAVDFSSLAGGFLRAGRQLLLDAARLQAFELPALDLNLEHVPGVGNTADLLFTARSVRQPEGLPLVVERLAASATVRLAGGTAPLPLRLHLAAQRAEYAGQYTATDPRATLTARLLPGRLNVLPGEAHLALGSLDTFGETALAPVFHVQLAHWPDVRAEAALQLRGEVIAAEVEARLREQSARVRAHGRVAPALVSDVLTRRAPKFAPYFVFGDPVGIDLTADFSPGWHFAGLGGRVRSGRLDSHGVQVSSATGRVAIDPQGNFLADDAVATLGENYARGSYWMNFLTRDYRMLLEGRLQPLAINGWFRSDWWEHFWADYAFPGGPPKADVEVSGRWTESARTVYFGQADAQAAAVLGADFETVHTRLFVRPLFQHALELSATRAGGSQRIEGTFKRFGQVRTRETQRIEFELTSNLDPGLYAKLAPSIAPGLVAAWRFTTPPRVQAAGRLDSAGGRLVPEIKFSGQVEGPLHYQGLPIDAMAVKGGVSDRDVRLDAIDFRLAGGTGSGHASLGGPAEARTLGFDLYLKDADLARAIRAVEQYEADRTGTETARTESKFIQRATGGRLELALSANGRPGDIASFRGGGNATLTGAELGEIHLFGLLSQVLSAVSLKFSSLKLDSARTSFRLEDGHVRFPDLRISGPSALIEARGDYQIAGRSLDFTARLKPYEETHNPLTAALGIVLNPLTRIFELKLSGPITKPSWSVNLGTGERPPTAEAPPATPAANPVPPETKPDKK